MGGVERHTTLLQAGGACWLVWLDVLRLCHAAAPTPALALAPARRARPTRPGGKLDGHPGANCPLAPPPPPSPPGPLAALPRRVFMAFHKDSSMASQMVAATDCLAAYCDLEDLHHLAVGAGPAVAASWRNYVLCQVGAGEAGGRL